jgi:transposase InsO family protein
MLKKRKISISMTEGNHCYENAMAERVNGILKDEYLSDRTFKDLSHAQKACEEAIVLYNTRRPHGSLNFKTAPAGASCGLNKAVGNNFLDLLKKVKKVIPDRSKRT